MNFKKTAAAFALATLGAVSVAHAATDPSAVVMWSGVVPSTTGTDTAIITGFNGELSPLSGTINANTDGTFTSSKIVLELHEVTAGATGGLYTASFPGWKVVSDSLTYNGVTAPSAKLDVLINGTVVPDTSAVEADTNTINVSVKQNADLTSENVGGATVQASVTLIADLA